MFVSCGSLQCSTVWPVPNCRCRIPLLISSCLQQNIITLPLFFLILIGFHWITIIFKIFLTAYKALHNLTPLYTCDVLTSYTQSCQLRSSPKHLLLTLSYNLKTYCARSFSMAAPTLWNAPPFKIRNSLSVFVLKKRNSKCFCLRSLLAIYFRLMFLIFS